MKTKDFADDTEPERLADLLVGYWTNFARTGDPNRGLAHWSVRQAGVPRWPRTFGDPDTPGSGETGAYAGATPDVVLHVAGADFEGCVDPRGGGECDVTAVRDYHDAPCDWCVAGRGRAPKNPGRHCYSTLSLTVIGWHSNIAVIAVIFCQNDCVAPG